MEKLAEKVQDVSLDDKKGEDLPPEVQNLIKSMVEDGAEEAEKEKEVTAEDLRTFFENAVEEIAKDDLRTTIIAAVEGKEEKEEKLSAIKSVLNPLYDGLWADLKIDAEVGRHAISEHKLILQDQSLDQNLRVSLAMAIKNFSRTEQGLVRRILVGEEKYQEQLDQEKKLAETVEEMQKEMEGLTPKEQNEMIIALKEQGETLRQKLKGLGKEAAVEYITKPSPEDQTLLYKLSALTKIIQATQPQGGGCQDGCCGGHSHAPPQPPPQAKHGHTHDGKPCGGHGHHSH